MDSDTNYPHSSPDAWGEDESEVFVEYGRAMVPGREEIERAILDLIPAEPEEPFLGVEIGIGTGWLSAAVLRRFTQARMLGLDGSTVMLKIASERLAEYKDRVELRHFRLEQNSDTNRLPQARVFLSSLVFHHLEGADKRTLFTRLFDRLEPGGALLFADVMAPQSALAGEHSAAAWEEETRRRSVEVHGDGRAHEFFIRERWNIYRHPDPMDKPSTIPDQLRWMEEVGFEGADVFWARSGHALLGGYKPS